MRKIAFFILVFLTSCSKTEPEPEQVAVNKNVSVAPVATIFYETLYFNSTLIRDIQYPAGDNNDPSKPEFYSGAIKYPSNNFQFKIQDIPTQNNNLLRIYFNFNQVGDLINVNASTGNISYYNYKNFVNNYFTLNIINIDNINKTIKGSFSGKLYNDPYDLSSNLINVSGTFYKSFGAQQYTPGEYLSPIAPVMKINSADWRTTNNAFINSVNFTDFATNFNSVYCISGTDQYKIVLSFDTNASPASYNFGNDYSNAFARIGKFNVITKRYDWYDSSNGILNVTSKTVGFATGNLVVYRYIGDFSFTATNPNNLTDILNVTNGTFQNY